MAELTGIDLARVRELEEAENARFVAERPMSMALQERARRSMPRGVPMAWMDDLYDHPPIWVSVGEGSSFTDVDGHTYLDLYVADMSAFCGHAPPPVIDAVANRMKLGNQFLLPGDDAIAVAEHLADRYGLPKWQFTLSATQANTEVIRLARELTGREIVLMSTASTTAKETRRSWSRRALRLLPKAGVYLRESALRPASSSSTTSARSSPRSSPATWPSY
jgi:glutamate-1-semialdehyde 2,1-aminomutase